jgi:hypothetical protein
MDKRGWNKVKSVYEELRKNQVKLSAQENYKHSLGRLKLSSVGDVGDVAFFFGGTVRG